MIHEKREADGKSGSAGAYFPGGVYCYEKKLEHAEELRDKHVEILFEGVYEENSTGCRNHSLTSAGRNLGIILQKEEATVRCKEPIYINLGICDGDGIVEANRDQEITVTVEGGRLLAFGSANPRTEESFDSGSYTTYYGHAQIIVMREEPGIMTIKTKSEEFGEAVLKIEVK